jgi:hypothetical protein
MLADKEKIKGAILIFSCHKHKETRLKEFGLKDKEYNGWKVFYILGNPNITSEYITVGNTILLKCEDSYIHVAKKVVMGLKYIYDHYEVEEGILRCGDDLIFNKAHLSKFLNKTDKTDYMGVVFDCNNELVMKTDNFMPQYYLNHQEDLQNPLHNIPYSIQEMMKFNIVPKCRTAGGVVVYLSNRSCNILINHFSNIEWNVFTPLPIENAQISKKDDNFGYPYIIEDVAVGYILYINNIFASNYQLYVDDYRMHLLIDDKPVAIHTNKYK